MQQNIAAQFLDVVKLYPDRTALWCLGDEFTYSELKDAAASIAAVIKQSCPSAKDIKVAILSERTSCAYTAVLGTLLAGAAYVPLNPRFPLERNRSILESSGSNVLICDAHNQNLITELVCDLSHEIIVILPESDNSGNYLGRFLLKADMPGEVSDQVLVQDCGLDSLAYLFFTSGSTGRPKGVPISHRNLQAYLRNLMALVQVTKEDRIIQLVDLTFDLSVHDMFVTWLSGATLYSVPERATLMAGRFVEDHDITGWLSVPSTAGLLKQAGILVPGAFPSLRFTLFCGETLTGTVAEAWCASAPNSLLYNLYGPTEATVAFSSYLYEPKQVDPPTNVPIGHPFGGQFMALFDSNNCRSNPGEAGEICLSGSQVTSGYWKSPDLNLTKFFKAEGKIWYRTGDLGKIHPDYGYLFGGRVDHQVKIRGYRVEIQEIEAVVRKASGRDVVAVVPWPVTADQGATGCIAFISGPQDDCEVIRAICIKSLPEYMVPTNIIFLNEMPLNSNGKVDYTQLKSHSMLNDDPK
jgi:amino acid adenylation domain-containing protein